MHASPQPTVPPMRRFLGWIARIGAPASEADDARLSRVMLVFGGLLMSGGGLLWGTIAAAYGQFLPAVIPFGYVLATGLNLAVFHARRDFELARFAQVLLSLLLPFFFQWSLGGFVASGGVMMWALIAIVGSLTFTEPPKSVVWLALFCLLTVVSGLIDQDVRRASALRASDEAQVAFFVVNIVVITSIVFGLTIYLTYRRNAAAEALAVANASVGELNRRLVDAVEERERDIVELRALERELRDRSAELGLAHGALTDSIRYASLIQRAMLPRPGAASEGCASFVLWLPRDLVGGDLWVQRSFDGGCLFGVIDCAGHGVPGACMTMIAHAALQIALAEVGWRDPAATIAALDRACRAMFSAAESGHEPELRSIATSLELGLCVVDREAGVVRFAGARMHLLHVGADGTCTNHRGGARSVNGTRIGSYANHELPAVAGEMFYLATDGLLDQAGGPRGHAFGSARLSAWAAEHASRDLEAQRASIEAEIVRYRGAFPQRDDLTILGFRVGGASLPSRVLDAKARELGLDGPPILAIAGRELTPRLGALRAELVAAGASRVTASDVFGVTVELAQNIERAETRHPSGHDASLVVGHRYDGAFLVATWNVVSESDAADVVARVAAIRGLRAEELAAARRAQLRSPRDGASRGAGVGLYTVAQRAAEPIEASVFVLDAERVMLRVKCVVR
jgi:hypothetical protein